MSPWRIGLVLAAVAVRPAAADGQTVDQVIARYLQARGGLERIRAVQSLRFTGKMKLGDVETPLVVELKRPQRMRTEFEVQGRTLVRAYDGERGWTILPVPGLDRPRLMPDDESRDAREQADVDLSPLVDPVAKGYAVELQGREKLDGREYYRLLVRAGDGSERTLLMDTKTALAVRSEEKRMMEGQLQEFVTLIGDYRPVAGLLFPHSIEVGPRGGAERQRLTFERIEVNPPLDDARFVMPEVGVAPARERVIRDQWSLTVSVSATPLRVSAVTATCRWFSSRESAITKGSRVGRIATFGETVHVGPGQVWRALGSPST